jgi:hypothetical protein
MCSIGTSLAAEPTPADLEFFEKRIRPVLIEHCYECHGMEEQSGGLRLDSRATLLKGGESGSAAKPGEPAKSRLVEAIGYNNADLQMPPTGKLPLEITKDLTKWVKIGLPWPREESPDQTPAAAEFDLQGRKQQHWAWQPVRPQSPPKIEGSNWPTSPIDAFVLEKLQTNSLSPSPPADRRTLIRRLFFDLTGLPPTPDEVEIFVTDRSPDAYEDLVDGLLNSVHYAEHWARHWLDLVRYADTYGHEFDYPIPHAWRYRDYVIRAFDADVPYDDFVVEQIAGDLLEKPRLHPTEGTNESIVGTGFWFLGEATHAPVDVRGDEAGRIDNQIDVMTKTFLGLTVACARCHDHKFDAISTKDYYALSGFLQSSRRQEALLDPQGKIEAMLPDLQSTRQQIESTRRSAAGRANDAGNDTIARSLLATHALAQSKAGSGEEHSAAEQIAQRFGIDRELLLRWAALLADEATAKSSHPFYAWVAMTRQADDGTSDDFAAKRDHVVASLGEETAKSEQALTQTRLFEGFEESGYGNWFVTGNAFGDGPTRPGQGDAASANSLTPPGVAHSGTLSNRLQGVLRSPTFEITSESIYYRMAGRGGQIRLIIDGYVMDVYNRLLFGGISFKVETEDAFVWHRQNVAKHIGHRAYIEIIDHGDGYVAVDEIRFGDHRLPLQSPHPLATVLLTDDAVTSLEQLADAYGSIWQETLQHLHGAVLDSAQTQLLNVVLHERLFSFDPDTEKTLLGEQKQLVSLGQSLRKPIHVLAAADGTGEDERVHIRGSHKSLGEPVPRRFLESISGAEQQPIRTGSGRLELARRMTDPSNPVVSRVMVNRVWHHLFGRGIVASTDNFGMLGERATHPDLLDFLADRFIQEGWSLKRLIKSIVMSSTYRMSSRQSGEQVMQIDPENLLLQRMRIRRLRAESIRDSILAVSGRLDRTTYGPSVPIYLTDFMQGRGRPKKSGPLDGAGRRSIYISLRRNFLSPTLLAFDMPIPFTTIGRRSLSNVPAQSLILMNDPFVAEQARFWAQRVLSEERRSPQARIGELYASAFARPPEDFELAGATAFLKSQGDAYGLSPEESHSDERVWGDLCHVLINAKEFIFVR